MDQTPAGKAFKIILTLRIGFTPDYLGARTHVFSRLQRVAARRLRCRIALQVVAAARRGARGDTHWGSLAYTFLLKYCLYFLDAIL
jgi:hypothetical protein